jgi:glycerol-3-phosphate dehydrogenase (NAD(P)+)
VAQRLAREAGVDVPLLDAVNLLLSGTISIERIVAGLMSRPLKREN